MFTECKKACICSFSGNLPAEVIDSDKECMGLEKVKEKKP